MMKIEKAAKAHLAPGNGAEVKRRGLLRLGTLVTAVTGASAVSILGTKSATAAPNDKNPPTAYVPTAEKGAASGVATLDAGAKIPTSQLPDLSATILAKIRAAKPYISVDDMAQSGDLSVADAWQRAVDLAKTTGAKRIVAESNTYVFGAAGVNLGGLHGCTIEGLGKDSTIITGTANLFVLFYNTSACSKLTFKNLGFVGPGVDDAIGPRRGRTTTGPSFRTAIKIQGDLHPTTGLKYEARDIAIENCKFAGLVEGLPIYFSGVRGYSKLTNSVIENSLDPGWIFYENGICTNNVSRRSKDNGFSLSRGGSSVVVTGNEIEDCCYNAIWVAGYDAAAGPENIAITGNIGKRIGHNGVTLQKGGRNATITGNTFVDIYRGPLDEPSDEDGCGVFVAGLTDSATLTVLTWAENINISGNTIVNPARGGILVRAGVRSCLIQGNTIINPGSEFLADGVTPVGTSTVNHNFGTNVLIGAGYPQATTSNVRSVNNQFIDLRSVPRMIYGANNASNSTFYSQMGNWTVGSSQPSTETARTVAGGMQTFTGGLSSGSNSASVGDGYFIQVNGPATVYREYRLLTAGSQRWSLAAGNSGESGLDTGSDFFLRAYNDQGVVKSTVMRFTRDGKMAFNGVTPVDRPALPGPASDSSSAIALVNSMRTALINLGLGK
jgi:hypothetical protein